MGVLCFDIQAVKKLIGFFLTAVILSGVHYFTTSAQFQPVFPEQGGTGTTSTPSNNQILIGNTNKIYVLTAIPDCTGSNKLLFNSSTRVFSCSADEGGGAITINDIQTSTFSFEAGSGIQVVSSTGVGGLGIITITNTGSGSGGVNGTGTANYVAVWSGPSTIATNTLFFGGADLFQGGAFNASGTITQNGVAVLTTSTGLGVANFTSANISQWTNNTGYTTYASGGPWTAAIFEIANIASSSQLRTPSGTIAVLYDASGNRYVTSTSSGGGVASSTGSAATRVAYYLDPSTISGSSTFTFASSTGLLQAPALTLSAGPLIIQGGGTTTITGDGTLSIVGGDLEPVNLNIIQGNAIYFESASGLGDWASISGFDAQTIEFTRPSGGAAQLHLGNLNETRLFELPNLVPVSGGTSSIAITNATQTWSGLQTIPVIAFTSASGTNLTASGYLQAASMVDTGTTDALILANSAGLFGEYGGSACGGSDQVVSISATGTVLCSSQGAGGSGTVSTSSAVSANHLPYWTSDGKLSGTSTAQYSAGFLHVYGIASSTEVRTPSGTIATLAFTNASGTNLSATGYLQGGSGNITNVSSTNISVSGYGLFPTLNFTNASGSALNATTYLQSARGELTNVSSTNISVTGYGTFPTLSFTNSSGTNSSVSGYGTFPTLNFTNASGTNISGTGYGSFPNLYDGSGNKYNTSTLDGNYLSLSGNTLHVDPEVASSSFTLFQSYATTTNGDQYVRHRVNKAQTILQISCDAYSGTSTFDIYKGSSLGSYAVGTLITTSTACGTGGTTITSFNTSTLAAGDFVIASTTAVAGTSQMPAIYIFTRIND